MQKTVGVNHLGRWIGQDHQNARLTDAECELIRRLHEDGLSYKKLADKFGIGKSTVRDIVTFRRRGQFAVEGRTVRVPD